MVLLWCLLGISSQAECVSDGLNGFAVTNLPLEAPASARKQNGRTTLTAAEVHEWLTRELESLRPSSLLSEPFSPRELDGLNEWWDRQIDSRITLELCATLAAIDERSVVLDHCLRVLNRTLASMLLDMQEKVAVLEGGGAISVQRINAARTTLPAMPGDQQFS